MIKIISLLLFLFNLVLADYEIIDEQNIFTIKTKDSSFDDLYLNLRDEINFESFVIVHELNLAKSTASVAEAFDKKAVVSKGVNLLICKSSFTLAMHEENVHNMTYCPMVISVYEYKDTRYISYRKYHTYSNSDKIANEINEKLKSVILNSLN